MNNIWDKEHKNKPANKELLKNIDKKFNITLPILLKKAYQISNGGYLDKNLYFNKRHYEWRIIFLEGLLPLQKFETLKDVADTIDFGVEEEDWNRIGEIDKLVIISRIGFSSFTCLDYRKSKTKPKLVVYDTSLIAKLVEEYSSFENALLSLKIEMFENDIDIDNDTNIDNEVANSNNDEKLLINNQKNIDLIIKSMQNSFDISKIPNDLLIESVNLMLKEVSGNNDANHIENLSFKSILKCSELMHKNTKN